MKKIGLALSGGGFRASLYHLGLVRFLRDANILPQVTHITSVSGGSIFAAHLVLNWNRYNGSTKDFEEAASAFLAFVRMDVRNRITRRFPLAIPWRWLRRLAGYSNRKLTRTGLLELHYEKYLYGDTSLFELPEKPELHLLATNVSEGCLCSFNRKGLLMVRRQAGQPFRIDHIHVGLATVPMAVTASSAFPGFFPPLELTGADVGAKSGEFGKQAYTDGGVFDNLGVRMFRCLEAEIQTEQNGLDAVLVSDVGKRIEVQGRSAGGLIRTALRATDILMDRVWQLENETFQDTTGFVFAPITEVVEQAEDPTALHPEIQRQVANVRTDIDRFSPLEISSLIRHGYCVGRKTCRAHPELFGAELPANAPWDPNPVVAPSERVAAGLQRRSQATASPYRRIWNQFLDRWDRHDAPGADMPGNLPGVSVPAPPAGPPREPAEVTVEARTLQASAVRRIWSTLLDFRDWTSYVYVPIIVPLLLLTPYLVIKSYQRSHQANQLMQSFAQGSHDFDKMSFLLDNGTEVPWTGADAEEVSKLDDPDLKGFEILQASVIVDLRSWKPPVAGLDNPNSAIRIYRRFKVLKLPDNVGNNLFRFRPIAKGADTQFRFPRQQLTAKLYKNCDFANSERGDKMCRWEVTYDFQNVLPGESVDILLDDLAPGRFFEQNETSARVQFTTETEAIETTKWILMPAGKEYRSFRMLRREKGKSGKLEEVRPVSEFLAEDSTILAFKLLSVRPGYVYELDWYYR